MPKQKRRPRSLRLNKLTASLCALAIIGAVSVAIYAPAEAAKAFIALVTFVAGAILKGLFQDEDAIDDRDELDPPTGPTF